MKKFYLATFAVIATVILAACGEINKQTRKKTRRLPLPCNWNLQKISWRLPRKKLRKKGYKINIMEVSDNVAYNDAVQHDEADANFAQHQPFMEMFNKEKKADLVAVQPIYYFAGGFYSKEYQDAKDLPENAKVGIPSDPTNEGRALAILNANGVIKLKEGVGFNGTVADVVENPKTSLLKALIY